MTGDELEALKVGDLVRHKQSGSAMVIVDVGGSPLVAVCCTAITNAREWDRVDVEGNVVSDADDDGGLPSTGDMYAPRR